MSVKLRKYVKHSRVSKLSRKQFYGLIVVGVIVVSSLAVYAFFSQPDYGFKAAIVDQLSSREDFKNITFVKTANATLTAAGYAVTYYNGSDVTVNFYRGLPSRGYKIIWMRVHSALYNGTEAPLDLFTSEPYSAQYPYEQSNGWLNIAMYQEGGEQYFGILHGFVANAMLGDFRGAVIILMGCNGLDRYARSRTMLQALVESKGAKAVIGWDLAVNVQHTDKATARLLHHLLLENRTIKEAVNVTMNEVGPDPYFQSVLKFYPNTAEVANYKIPLGIVRSAAAEFIVKPNSFAGVSVCVLSFLVFNRRRFVFGGFRKKSP
ncbi:MAG: hypothetical protein QXM22_00835 [Candidatus Bathyarchaeia archaeon]